MEKRQRHSIFFSANNLIPRSDFFLCIKLVLTHVCSKLFFLSIFLSFNIDYCLLDQFVPFAVTKEYGTFILTYYSTTDVSRNDMAK